jgi:para-aminobenzoate synthetase component 1
VIHHVSRTRLSGWVDPASIFEILTADELWSVWLDAGPHATAGRSYIGIPRSRVLSDDVESGRVTVSTLAGGFTVDSHEMDATIFDVLREDLAGRIIEDIESPGFHLGWVGWFGYELAAQTTGVRTVASSTPDARLVFLDRALEFDHEAQTVTLLELADASESWHAELEVALTHAQGNGLVHRTTTTTTPAENIAPSSVTWRHSPERYEALVRLCLEAITRGDAYQLCLTNEVRVAAVAGEAPLDPVQTYLRLRRENPSHHGGLLRFGEVSLLSSSPEVFLTISSEGHVETKPIKGTRRRGDSPQLDQELASELRESEKERAENLMIVDLMRNDVGRVAQLGTVNVDALLDVETYENVHQLVSTISAELLPGMTATDALEACFPAGSMTGAPKISAMQILSELENGPRGIYSGAFGYLSLDGSAELAMVIRSIVLDASGASIGTGGGITSGSIPREELEETWVKVNPLLRALGVSTLDYS